MFWSRVPSGEEDLREREEAAGRRSLPRPAGPRLPEELQHVHLPRPLAVRPAGPAPRRRVRLCARRLKNPAVGGASGRAVEKHLST